MARPKKDFTVKPVREQSVLVKMDLPPKPKLTIAQVLEIASDARSVLEGVRQIMLEPFPRKQSPEFTVNQVAELCGMSRVEFRSAEVSIGSTRGSVHEGDATKSYTLEETIDLVQQIGGVSSRPAGQPGSGQPVPC